MIVSAVKKAEPGAAGAMKGELLRNIVLAGGSTLFDGMAGRVASEVKSRCTIAHTGDVQVLAPEGRGVSAWAGGAMLASIPTFNEQWITREAYDEQGPSVVNTACPD